VEEYSRLVHRTAWSGLLHRRQHNDHKCQAQIKTRGRPPLRTPSRHLARSSGKKILAYKWTAIYRPIIVSST
jgi:hypothetical protein